jgi:hypothetical protein
MKLVGGGNSGGVGGWWLDGEMGKWNEIGEGKKEDTETSDHRF